MNIDLIDFIKIDVEGHEPHVLQGGESIFKHQRPYCMFEYNPLTLRMAKQDPVAISNFFRKLDYGLFAVSNNSFQKVNYEAPQRVQSATDFCFPTEKTSDIAIFTRLDASKERRPRSIYIQERIMLIHNIFAASI